MTEGLIDLTLRFFITFGMLIVLSGLLYYPKSKKKEFVFTFISVGVTVYFLSFLLSSVNMELGLALGLFAIFGILRYRTIPVQIREMTYLFLSITLSIINSLSAVGYPALLILGINLLILLITWLLERILFKRAKGRITVNYEKIELIKPDKRQALIADLEERLGMKILDVRVGSINFLRDTAEVEITYDADAYPQFRETYQVK